LRDYRVWWALFVFFAVLSILVVQLRYRRWLKAGQLLAELKPGALKAEHTRRWRLEGWRLLSMIVSLAAMTGLLFAVFLAAPAAVVATLRVLALVAVLGVLALSLRW
jgi:hypothetical protein